MTRAEVQEATQYCEKHGMKVLFRAADGFDIYPRTLGVPYGARCIDENGLIFNIEKK